jgi:membrane-associated phospholipid phosphatase
MPEWIGHLDTSLFLLLNRDLQNSLFDVVMPLITSRMPLIVAPLLIFFLIKERKKAVAVLAVCFFSLLLSDASSMALKGIVGRIRPCNVLENVHLLVGCTKSFSLPSGHATNSFAFAVAFILMTRGRLRYVFIFLAALISLSRIFVGVHYPFDVITGALLGSLCAGTVVFLYRWAESRFRDRPYSTVLYVFLLILCIFRIYFIRYGPFDLSPEEAHYWEWSRRLGLIYYSKGPMIAYLIAAGTAIFGVNVFGVRVFAVAFSLLGSLTLYKLGKEMFDERVGASSAILFQLIPLYSVFGVIFTVDSAFTFFWILALYLFWRAVGGQEAGGSVGQHHRALKPSDYRQYWILLGITVGLGLLTEYTMAFFYICSLLLLLSSSGGRRILKTPIPYISLIVSLAVFAPVIVWNASHGWVTVRHALGQMHIEEGMKVSAGSFFDFVGSQLAVLTPIICALIVVAAVKARSGRFSDGGDDRMPGGRGGFIFWFSVPVIAFFVLKSIQGKVEANWAMTGYLTGIIGLSSLFLSGWKRRKLYLKVLIVAGIVLSSLMTAVSYYPAKFHIPLKLDPSSRLRGWKELGKEADALYHGLRSEGDAFIFSDSYQVASELAFYMEGRPTVYCVNVGRRMNRYDLWPEFNDRVHSNAVFVTIADARLSPIIANAFGGCGKNLFTVYEKGKLLRQYSLFVCRDFRGIQEKETGSY